MATISEVDREALDRALRVVNRIAPAIIVEAVASLLENSSWFDAARYAAFHCQYQSLDLRPWQECPCDVTDPDTIEPDDPYAQMLLRRLLAAGLSRFEPEPEVALARRPPR
jgi:hypothetical protein